VHKWAYFECKGQLGIEIDLVFQIKNDHLLFQGTLLFLHVPYLQLAGRILRLNEPRSDRQKNRFALRFQGIRSLAMSTITTNDGVEIFYKDWGQGQPIVFSHGWPLLADDWDTQKMFFLGNGFPHGMPTTESDTINADLLNFLKG
jgi:hypothetical protein